MHYYNIIIKFLNEKDLINFFISTIAYNKITSMKSYFHLIMNPNYIYYSKSIIN